MLRDKNNRTVGGLLLDKNNRKVGGLLMEKKQNRKKQEEERKMPGQGG